MKKLVLLLLLVCTCATLSWAQSGKRITVTGSVIDGDDKSPVGQATVQLLSLPDSTMVVEMLPITTEYSLLLPARGNMYLKFHL